MTAGLAGVGAGLFFVLGLPLPFLFGPLFACLLGALLGLPLVNLGIVSVFARTIIGVTIGASITPEVVSRVPEMAVSVALIPAYVAIIGLVGVPFFRRVYRFDPVTSWYAAMPGGLQDMVLFGRDAGGDVRALSLIHATRLLVIVTLAPFILAQGFEVEITNFVGQPASTLPAREMLLMAAAAVIGWFVATRIGLFGASILGPLIATAALSLGGFIHSRPPAEAIATAQFFIGIAIGVGYVGVTLAEIRRDVLAGVFFVFLLAAIAALFTEIVVLFSLANAIEGFLAFAPGGQAEMAILALIAGADLGYIIVHHITRVFLVITCAPIAARLVGRFDERGTPPGG